MSRHTPGPWEVRSYDKDHQRDLHGIFQVGKQLPIVEAVWGRNISESDANAKLVAAAPQLLDALRASVDALDTARDGKPIMVNLTIAAARAAIAAATGDT